MSRLLGECRRKWLMLQGWRGLVFKMVCGCEATISSNDPRAEIWQKVFGKLSFPLKHPLQVKMDTFPGKLFYVGDGEALTLEQKQRLIDAMSEKFNIPKSEIAKNLEDKQIPILAENIVVSICEWHFRAML